MSGGDWARVKELFEEALRLPSEEREAWVRSQSEGDSEVEAEVLSLLSTYDEAPDFLEGASPVTPLAGRRLGAWELVREIGRGGMGVVWEARRADREYEQRAAVKLLPLALLGVDGVARFRAERQILARLEHPGIARLLDGGAAPDGTPYLVMEYIDGEPLDRWCERRNLGLRERLELFRKVCDAVTYAHRHLIVHRDLKPANILVSADGVPKLLDFGIAKLLESSGEESERAAPTAARLLTPDYASPEQIAGGAITTASDVFSLGALLYVLVTGKRPFGEGSTTALDVARAVCEREPAPPGDAAPAEWKRQIRGGLDAIVLHALRKFPEDRYASVRSLSADVLAWLEGRPVTAHPESRWRRAMKFVRRNRVPSAAVALAAVSLIAGSAVALWQAHAAHEQRVRAETRFREVRQLSRALLFELHESIRNLPGATHARKLLLDRATEFLDGLARDAGTDAALKIELAEGYRRLGHVQGSSFSDNLGQADAALASYRKALRMGEDALALAPGSADAKIVLLGVYEDLTDAFLAAGARAEADAWYHRHRELLARMEAAHPRDDKARGAAASSYSSLAFYEAQRNNYAEAKKHYARAIEMFHELQSRGVIGKELRAQFPFALKRLGAILITENQLEEAERNYRRALDLETAMLAQDAGNSRLRVDRTFTLSDLGLVQRKRGRLAEAAALYEEVASVRRAALEADPDNVRLMGLAASAETFLAVVAAERGGRDQAIAHARTALEQRGRAASITRKPRENVAAAAARVFLASQILEAGGPQGEAAALLGQAAPAAGELKRRADLGPFEKSFLADFDAAQRRLAANR